MSHPADLEQRIKALAPWFHNIELNGIQTAPDHFLGDYPSFKWKGFRHLVPEDLRGRTVLDIGCNGGFYSLEMKRRRADLVVGVDSDPRCLAQARLAAEASGLDISFRQLSVYEIGALRQRFDFVIFMGVLYHLRHPLLALDLIHEHVVGDQLLCQSMLRGNTHVPEVASNYPFEEQAIFEQEGYPRMVFIEHNYAEDPTNWWVPNRSGMEAMLRSAGFRIVGQTDDEVYLCHREERPAMVEPPPRISFDA
ncbi:TIGR04290 family methyltransferase [Microvirga rosea]|uniref:TIGR04290 family methyltransferase n=1 Tax=Microvirga rosea TaxID=2715425 RepID=UPI001D0AD25B|nr:TIGR04290 family methyltransferase [Microvirga rosea]MCB8821958.1 TIGR04290 family methyltransferase [Microvirga rosea]